MLGMVMQDRSCRVICESIGKNARRINYFNPLACPA